MVQACNPSIREAETVGSFVGDQPGYKGRSLEQEQKLLLTTVTVQGLYQPWGVRTLQTYSAIAEMKPKEALSHGWVCYPYPLQI